MWLVKKFDSTFSRFDTISACDIRTDGRTSCVRYAQNRTV